jgi:P22 coat protein - gene protein 5
MPNTLLTIGEITYELLDCFENNLVFCKGIMRKYSSEFAVPGNKIGPTLSIRLPAQLRTTSGPNLQAQDYVEQSVPLTIDQQEHVDLQFSSFEMTLSLDDWRRRIGRPSGIVLANKVDAYGLGLYWAVPNAIISPPVTPTVSKWKAYLQAGAILADNGTPEDGTWRAILNQWEQVEVVSELKGLFQSSEQIKRQYERGLMGESGGLTWAWDQNVAVHTSGPLGGAPLYATTVAGGASITVSGFSTAAALRVKKGDIFTIANVNAVNPVSLASTGKPRQFVATADVNSAADGTATIPIYPPIIGPATPANPRQTVAALPVGAAPLTFLMTANTAYYQNICHHEQAFGMGMCRLQEPFSGQSAYAVDSDTGVATRTWKASDISTDQHASRADIAFGMAVTRPQWACRVISSVSGT